MGENIDSGITKKRLIAGYLVGGILGFVTMVMIVGVYLQ